MMARILTVPAAAGLDVLVRYIAVTAPAKYTAAVFAGFITSLTMKGWSATNVIVSCGVLLLFVFSVQALSLTISRLLTLASAKASAITTLDASDAIGMSISIDCSAVCVSAAVMEPEGVTITRFKVFVIPRK